MLTTTYLNHPDASGISEIHNLFEATFTDSEGVDEGKRIGTLVTALLEKTPDQDRFIYVAKHKKALVGCAIFSRITFEMSPLETFILSPMAVKTAFHGKGIGQNVLNFAHDDLRARHIDILLTYGDIRFYQKVGYRPIDTQTIPSPLPLTFPEGWLGQSLTSKPLEPISGRALCVSALAKPEYW